MKYFIKGQETYPIPIGDESCVSAEELFALFDEAITDYLHNEIRIISLARQKQLTFMQKYSLSKLEEYLWRDLDESGEIGVVVKTLANRMRKLLRDCGKENNFLPLDGLTGCEWWKVKIVLLTEDEETFPNKRSVLQGRHRYCGGYKGTYAIGVEITKAGEDAPLRYAASDEVIKRDGIFRNFKVRYTDLGILLAKVFLMKSTCEWLKSEGDSKAEEYAYPEGICVRKEAVGAEFDGYLDLLALVQKRHGEIPALSKEELGFIQRNKLPYKQMYCWGIKNIFKQNPADYLKEGYNPFYIMFDTCRDGRFESWFLSEELRVSALYVAAKKASEVKRAEEIREYENTSRAKSYQTKKNIPQKIQKMMEKSEFNQYFDYVEFDEDCDVERLKVVGKEVLAFFSEMPRIKEFTKGNSIRFRKLGNHKAIGLYYPYIQCLCVELRNTTSFIHELGHLIDHCMDDGGQLSEQPAFFKLLSLYRSYLDGNKKDIGKGKYDLGYYKEATEVFARSFELYIVKVKKYKNNLIPDSFTKTHYPEEREDIMSEIKNYFDSLNLIGESSAETCEKPEEDRASLLTQIEEAVKSGSTIYVRENKSDSDLYPVADARKKKFENCRITTKDGVRMIADLNGVEVILGHFTATDVSLEVKDYLEKNHLEVVRIEAGVSKVAAAAVPSAPTDLKDLRGQDLLNAIKAPSLQTKEKEGYGTWVEYDGDIHEWFLDLSRAFNSFNTGNYTIPDEWMKNKAFWRKVSYIELVNLSKDAGTWDERKKLAAEVCMKLFLDSDLRTHAEEIGGFAEERRGVDFFYLLKSEFKQEHSTIRQSMATFLMKYLYETDKVFKKAADTMVPDYASRKFRFPMI